jgi:biopolymer transport protein TolQ
MLLFAAEFPIFRAFRESDLFGQLILLVLFAFSVFAWSVILRKYLAFRQAQAASRSFRSTYRKHSDDPLQLIEQEVYLEECPFFEIADRALEALHAEVERRGTNPRQAVPMATVESIEKNLDRTIGDETLKLERGLNLLATAASACPLIGLLGTVWGVLLAFQRVAEEASAQIHVISQGISVALSTTVVGLLVAIPSLVMYNWMTTIIRRFETEMESFASEVLEDIERRYVES